VTGAYYWSSSTAQEAVFDFEPPDDVRFLNRLLNKLLRDYPIDPRRVYIYGYSNGAAMAHRMACDAAHRFAAIVAGAGTLPGNDPQHVCAPSVPVSVLHFHSKDDEVVQFNGGNFSSLFGIVPDHPALDYGGAIETVVRWAVLNGCTGVLKFGTEPTLNLDIDAAGKETTINRVTQCPKGVDVELWSMEGVDHPPLSFRVGPDGIKTLAKETWKFLRVHKSSRQQ
jgi:polyhydroxybutyrate depolymerase